MKAYAFDVLSKNHTAHCPASRAVVGFRIQLRNIDEALYGYQWSSSKEAYQSCY